MTDAPLTAAALDEIVLHDGVMDDAEWRALIAAARQGIAAQALAEAMHGLATSYDTWTVGQIARDALSAFRAATAAPAQGDAVPPDSAWQPPASTAAWTPTDEMVRECAAWIYRGSWSKEIETARAVISPLAIDHYWLRSGRAALTYAREQFGAEAERLRTKCVEWERDYKMVRGSWNECEAEIENLRAQLSARPTAPLPAVPAELLDRLPPHCKTGWISDEMHAVDELLRIVHTAPQARAMPTVEELRNIGCAAYDKAAGTHGPSVRAAAEAIARAVLAAIPQPTPVATTLIRGAASMTDEEINYLVNRFLGWKLPVNFSPDGGIAFEPMGNKGTSHEYKRQPSGTNLLDAQQATAMVRYMIDGLSFAPAAADPEAAEIAGRLPHAMDIYRWTEPAGAGLFHGRINDRLAMMGATAYVRKRAASTLPTSEAPPQLDLLTLARLVKTLGEQEHGPWSAMNLRDEWLAEIGTMVERLGGDVG